jgi:hypothetical protein
LAEIYTAISSALLNLEEITGEIEREDRLSAQASLPGQNGDCRLAIACS